MELLIFAGNSLLKLQPYAKTLAPLLAGVALFHAAQTGKTTGLWLRLGLLNLFICLGSWAAFNYIVQPSFAGQVAPFPAFDLVISSLFFSAGLAAYLIWLREGQPWLDARAEKLTKRSSLERNRKTDIREINKFIPEAGHEYDPTSFFNLKNGIFIGLDEEEKAVYVSITDFDESHILLSGRSRIGKGVSAQGIISQTIAKGDFNVILDPKSDNFMPHVFFAACEKYGKPYFYFNLNSSFGFQINPFLGANEEMLENMLTSGFGLDEKGDIADHYRLKDRDAARECARWLFENKGATLAAAFNALGAGWVDKAAGFHSHVREMASLRSINARDGVDIDALVREGGCVYVVGDMSNTRILRAQRIILLRLMSIAKNRTVDAETKKITVFADEFKCHISKPFMTSLGAAAGWGMHCILAFQSFSDLEDMPKDLDKNAVKGAVIENTAISISYGIKDPETADYISDMTGKILVDDETRYVERNAAMAEVVQNTRSIRQTERNLYDRNSIMSLKKGTAILSIAGQLSRAVHISKIKVTKTPVAVAVNETAGDEIIKAAELI